MYRNWCIFSLFLLVLYDASSSTIGAFFEIVTNSGKNLKTKVKGNKLIIEKDKKWLKI